MPAAQKPQHLIRLVLILSCLISLSACAEDVYRWRDQDGKLHYGSHAAGKAEKLKLKPGYSFFKVVSVFDGDTVKLEDGRKVRLLGINTPEVRHRNQAGEAGGEQAKNWLKHKLSQQKVRLVTDVEATDKYNRVLAHLFTEDKTHLNLELVEQGLASANIHPPNLKFADELAAAEHRAERASKGIWGKPEYAPVAVEQLGEDGHSGWTRIRGKVNAIRSSRKYVYMELSNLFKVRIAKGTLALFPDIDSYRGKKVEARGWLNKNRGGWVMQTLHPTALKTL